MGPLRSVPRALAACPRRDDVLCILGAALAAADPAAAVRRHVRLSGDTLHAGGATFDLAAVRRVRLVAMGKAAPAMAGAVARILGARLEDGIAIAKRGDEAAAPDPVGLTVIRAGHPIPDAAGAAGAEEILRRAESLGPDDLLIAAISGGASALTTLPAPDLHLADLQRTTELLLRSGARIQEVNAVRKHLSAFTGGRLAQAAAPARSLCLALSDVVGDPLDVIGSGPLAPDSTAFEDAWKVLEHYNFIDNIPESTRSHLRRGVASIISDTAKPGDPVFDRVTHLVVGSGSLAAQAAVDAARSVGFHAAMVTAALEGEAREAGAAMAELVRNVALRGEPVPKPACLVLAGETTVTVRGAGQGGRNQELALAAAVALDAFRAEVPGALVIALATDGGDGPTDAAGGAVTEETATRARSLGLNPLEFLDNNDAYHFLYALGDLVVTGPTGTNVADLVLVFVP